ncbi:hypothetical protein TNCV_18531, partial [Trichonephila clavipes]
SLLIVVKVDRGVGEFR